MKGVLFEVSKFVFIIVLYNYEKHKLKYLISLSSFKVRAWRSIRVCSWWCLDSISCWALTNLLHCSNWLFFFFRAFFEANTFLNLNVSTYFEVSQFLSFCHPYFVLSIAWTSLSLANSHLCLIWDLLIYHSLWCYLLIINQCEIRYSDWSWWSASKIAITEIKIWW